MAGTIINKIISIGPLNEMCINRGLPDFPLSISHCKNFAEEAVGINKNPNSEILVWQKFGDIYSNFGDILICPIAHVFLASNPISIHLFEKEPHLKSMLNKYRGQDFEFVSEHCVFLPCAKLKYRGVIFVEIDFHGDNEKRGFKNAAALLEAFELAEKFHCAKITLCNRPLYLEDRNAQPLCFDLNYRELMFILHGAKTKFHFDVEFIVKPLTWFCSIKKLPVITFPYSDLNLFVKYDNQSPECAFILD